MNWEFVSKIYKQRTQPYLDLPLDVSNAMRTASDNEGYLAVTGTLNETPIQALLVPRGGAKYRLFVNSDMRQRAKVSVGDTVHVSLALDFGAHELELPPDLAEIFANDAAARAGFEKLTSAKRNEMLKWLSHDQKDESRLKRLEHLRVYLTTGQM